MELNGLRQSYGDKALVCPDCGNAIDVESMIDEMENNPEKVIFTPKKVEDLCFTWCHECDGLKLHELKDKSDLKDTKIRGYRFPGEKTTETGEDNGSPKPFSVGN